jgi:hypothetical protein
MTGKRLVKQVTSLSNLLKLLQVVSNFSYNYVHDNWGYHILEVSGFEKVRLPIYQTTSHNGFYKYVATSSKTLRRQIGFVFSLCLNHVPYC